jgi:hypothetical protein
MNVALAYTDGKDEPTLRGGPAAVARGSNQVCTPLQL